MEKLDELDRMKIRFETKNDDGRKRYLDPEDARDNDLVAFGLDECGIEYGCSK